MFYSSCIDATLKIISKKHKELRLNANENNMTVKEVCGKHVKFLVKLRNQI